MKKTSIFAEKAKTITKQNPFTNFPTDDILLFSKGRWKNMEKTLELIMLDVVEEDGLLIKYCLYEEAIDGRASFSLECKCSDDSAFLSDITSERERASEIFDKFVRGSVTPISAHDVIEEILS